MRSPFSKDIYIRVTADETGLVCTTKCGWFRPKVTTLPLRGPSEQDEAEMAARRQTKWPRSMLGLTDSL